MLTPVIIRALEAEDRSEWERMFRDYIASYEVDVSDSTIDLTFRRLLGGEDNMQALVAAAAVDDRPLGAAHLVYLRSTWSPTWYCYLEDLFVDTSQQGRGVGGKLIDAVIKAAEARGCTRTHWVTKTDNVVARRLYDKKAKLAEFVQYRR